tara:strand:- start:752 stop:1054 length:303 start_codon:yes stop_codon:yes gene_type:complete
MPIYKVTHKDGTTGRIIASEAFCKEITKDGGSYELDQTPEQSDGEKKMWARDWRNNELANTDYIVPLTDHPQRDAYIQLRQKLRDWPSTSDFPETKPTLS